jgi:PEP-CTERM motif
MSLLNKALLVASLAVAIPVANALTIDFDDRSEELVVVIDGFPRTVGGESTLVISDFDPGLFTAADLLIVVLDPGTTDVSDVITVVVTPDAATSTTAYEIVFTSDAEGPLVPPAPPPPGVIEQFITETGDFQTIYSSHDLSTAGNPDWVFRFASDIETTVPEPGTLALLGLGFAGLGFSRRRKCT